MRPLSEATAKIAGKSFERKYIALGRIVNNWEDIVGQSFADKAQPMKIHYRKQKGKDKPLAILEIATSSADATRLHYQKGLILERMNQLFGERWITDLKFAPIVSNSSTKRMKKTPSPLTSEQKKRVSEIVLDIVDVEIKQRLEKLGHNIWMKNKDES